MKRLFIMAAVLTLASGAAMAAVTGTGHDLRGAGANNTGSDELCVHCHTPHNSTVAVPLWNHTLSSTAATDYTYYTSTTLTGSLGQDATSGITGMCMSCHDGTVGLGSLINTLQDTASNPTDTTTTITGTGLLGTDLSNDHPVGFTYATATAADTELVDPFVPANGVLLFGGNVECASCHDPHNDTNDPFLVVDNAASVICTTCHEK
jgi:predicted CXXCH cytochrome family protein